MTYPAPGPLKAGLPATRTAATPPVPAIKGPGGLPARAPRARAATALVPATERAPTRRLRTGPFSVLDIGSTKIVCLIGRGEPDNTIRILGHGWRRSHGVRSGGIVDLREAESAIRAAVAQAEDMATERRDSIFVNLSCGHPESRHINARWPIGGREITKTDVSRIIAEARARALSEGRSAIHTLPLDYAVDDTQEVLDPRGHLCDLLSARLHVIDANTTALRNLEAVLSRVELKIEGMVSSPLASGLAVMNEDERNLGATVVDMGGGTTSIGVFGEGRLLHTATIPVGGLHITRDIAHGLSTSIDNAERLKTIHGSAELLAGDDHDPILVQLIGDNDHHYVKIPRAKIVSIIHPRVEETLEMVRDRLEMAAVGPASDGRVILTGGGSLLEGIGPMAARILNRQVRLGRPRRIVGLPENPATWPMFSTSAGLLAWAAGAADEMGEPDTRDARPDSLVRRFVDFIRDRV
ncbi:cell division protein FtsA [Komagataeibacter rhaeticus]|uniref:cell division protein FtsA n=1 Tax=Komagataeibacter rhaeticus TaxID=215221 RepID=UPI0004D9EEB2|nr:cell division protein FtsA [Komagataeibacter rhaeticus]KDU96794.1 cell division protein FtsA [Komagataeibacter rhaeticus AF1]MBL7240187.1 cell division protein FtsA [Komagataeibacter rhaeticus]PYD52806.1 cell division protein FtsA [Komagataeibacter rhaeticus]GBQ10680.1 cell division protein FtsA [Komagataeibacter rhaeticus DSM 16663]